MLIEYELKTNGGDVHYGRPWPRRHSLNYGHGAPRYLPSQLQEQIRGGVAQYHPVIQVEYEH